MRSGLHYDSQTQPHDEDQSNVRRKLSLPKDGRAFQEDTLMAYASIQPLIVAISNYVFTQAEADELIFNIRCHIKPVPFTVVEDNH